MDHIQRDSQQFLLLIDDPKLGEKWIRATRFEIFETKHKGSTFKCKTSRFRIPKLPKAAVPSVFKPFQIYDKENDVRQIKTFISKIHG